MKILYLGHIVSKEESNENIAVSPIGNNMQIGIFTEIKKKLGDNLSCYSYIPLRSFPREKKIINLPRNLLINEDLTVKSFGFINIILLKQLSIMFSTFVALLTFLIKNRTEKKYVITYNVSTFFTLPMLILSRFFEFQKICYVVDIQEDILEKKQWISDKFRIIDNKFRMKFFSSYNGYLTFNVNVLKSAGIRKPYQQVYVGAYSQLGTKPGKKYKNDSINITYTGILEPYYNLENLVEAVKLLGDRYNLNIYGKGSLDSYLKEQSHKLNNINFYGYVTNAEAIKAQNDSDILISLLEPDSYFGKYAFPGKIFEYLLSGTPVVSTISPALPCELLIYLSTINNTEINTIVDKLREVTKSEKNYTIAVEKSKNGSEFINKNCSWQVQATSILKFLRNLDESR